MASADGFLQDPPRLGNQLRDDEFLNSQLRRLLPEEALGGVEPDLGAPQRCLNSAASLLHLAPRVLAPRC